MADVKLTKDEEKAALAAALKLKIEGLAAEEQAKADEEERLQAQKEAEQKAEAEARDRAKNPHLWYGLMDTWGNVGYCRHALPPPQGAPQARTLLLNRLRVEHVSEGDHGIWIYRHLG